MPTDATRLPGGRARDRRGRGMRGPAITPSLPGRPELPTRGERFDELVLETVRDIDTRWQDRLGLVEYAVEDTPQLPDDWAGRDRPAGLAGARARRRADPAGGLPPPDRAPLRDPGRPRGDGADRAWSSRSPSCSASTPRTSTRATPRRLTAPRSVLAGRDLGHQPLGQQLVERDDGRAVAGDHDRAADRRAAGARRGRTPCRAAGRPPPCGPAARRDGAVAPSRPTASYAVTVAAPAASAATSSVAGPRPGALAPARSPPAAGWPPPA